MSYTIQGTVDHPSAASLFSTKNRSMPTANAEGVGKKIPITGAGDGLNLGLSNKPRARCSHALILLIIQVLRIQRSGRTRS